MTTFPFPNVYRQTVTMRDAKGFTSTVKFYISIVGTATASDARTLATVVVPEIAALSNAAFQSANGPYSALGVAQYGTHASGGAYESVQQKVRLVFQDASGGLHRMEIPAPLVSIFLADKITVDPANTAVASLVSIANPTAPVNAAFVSTRSGQYLANFMGGIYVGRKRHRKENILTLTPSLTPEEPE